MPPVYGQTAAEQAAGVTPVDYSYEPGDVRRYGAVGDGVTDCTTSIQSAINVTSHSKDKAVLFPGGTFNYTDLYCFYDASLNPGYNNSINRHGKLRLVGSGKMSIFDI